MSNGVSQICLTAAVKCVSRLWMLSQKNTQLRSFLTKRELRIQSLLVTRNCTEISCLATPVQVNSKSPLKSAVRPTNPCKSPCPVILYPVFSTGQSVRPEGGRRWAALSGPVRPFSKLALRPGAKDYKPRRPPPSTVKHVSCQGTLPN